MNLSTRTRQIVYKRSGGRCEICGTVGVLQNHHRRPRGSGGALTRLSDSPANILRIHRRCHERIESFREWARDRGYLVPQRLDPSTVAVRLFDGWFLLGHGGEAVPCEGYDG